MKGMLAEKLHGTDPEDVILDAFKEFDENNTGFIPKVLKLFSIEINNHKSRPCRCQCSM